MAYYSDWRLREVSDKTDKALANDKKLLEYINDTRKILGQQMERIDRVESYGSVQAYDARPEIEALKDHIKYLEYERNRLFGEINRIGARVSVLEAPNGVSKKRRVVTICAGNKTVEVRKNG